MVDIALLFRVRRACGHVDVLPELLPRAEEDRYPDRPSLLAAREKALIALEAMVCVNCYSRDDIGTLVDDLRRLGIVLPDPSTMIGGTDKQTRLARLLRSRKTTEIRDAYARYRQALDHKIDGGVLSPDEAARQRAWCERLMATVLAIKDPDWWIARQTANGWELVRVVARRFLHT